MIYEWEFSWNNMVLKANKISNLVCFKSSWIEKGETKKTRIGLTMQYKINCWKFGGDSIRIEEWYFTITAYVSINAVFRF